MLRCPKFQLKFNSKLEPLFIASLTQSGQSSWLLTSESQVRILQGAPEFVPVAQLDRASGYGPEGWGFDFLRACQKLLGVVAHSGEHLPVTQEVARSKLVDPARNYRAPSGSGRRSPKPLGGDRHPGALPDK